MRGPGFRGLKIAMWLTAGEKYSFFSCDRSTPGTLNRGWGPPRGFELPGKDAVMWKEGERLIVEPALPRSLLDVLAAFTPLDEDLPEITDVRPRAVKLRCVTCLTPTSFRT